MVIVGVALLVIWLLVMVFGMGLVLAILATGLIFLVLGLLMGERLWVR